MNHRITTLALALALTACTSAPTTDDASPAEEPATHDETTEEHHAHHGHHGHDHSGHHDHRFEDPERYAERWNDPARDEWQQPRAIISAMEIREGSTVADIGAGTGYFTPYLSEAVGPEGRVIAVDIEEAMLHYIANMAEEQGLQNVDTREADFDSSNLAPGEVDQIITVNTWHHIANRGAYSAHLYEALTPGGSVWVVDYDVDSLEGPPMEHRLPAEVIIAELEEGGFRAELHELELDRQFIVVGHRD